MRDHLDCKSDVLFRRLEQAAGLLSETDKLTALDAVDQMFHKLHVSLKVDSKLKKEMDKIADQIRNGHVLLNDPTRYFVKEGILAKKCNRTGRIVKYNFFLFSDTLMYSHKSTIGDYIIHEELPLHLMKIDDPDTTVNISNSSGHKQKRSFHIIHPKKSFIVFALDPSMKDEWVTAITSSVEREVKRREQNDNDGGSICAL